MTVRLEHGDCRDVIKTLADCSVDSCVTDPPYSLVSIQKRFGKPGSAPAISKGASGVYKRASSGFMGQSWDTGETAFDPAWWAEVYRVLKPGAHLVAFSGTRTYHRMACAIEDAGFEIRDQLAWTYGTGFPKSQNVSKAIDKAAGASREVIEEGPTVRRTRPGADQGKDGTWEKLEDRTYTHAKTAPATPEAAQWEGWGTALKPAWESICLAQKPHDLGQLCAILARKIMEALCQLPSLARDAGASSSLSRSVFGEAFGSAQWSAAAACNTPDDLFALMVTLPSESGIPSSLSTALSWLDILGATLSLGSTSTTETKSSLTTDLRTLNSLLSQNTANTIIEAAIRPHGTASSASLAERIFSAVSERLMLTQELFALDLATSREGKAGLRPNWEPICFARKPLIGTVAANVQQHGTGALNIDDCRVPAEGGSPSAQMRARARETGKTPGRPGEYRETLEDRTSPERYMEEGEALGRWPANLIHDGSEEVLAAFAAYGDAGGGSATRRHPRRDGSGWDRPCNDAHDALKSAFGDSGSAARFFFSAKADADDRCDSKHPTVKPVALMRWLARLVTPPGGLVLDPFAGSGTTGVACLREGFECILIEREDQYAADIRHRIAKLSGLDTPLFAGAVA